MQVFRPLLLLSFVVGWLEAGEVARLRALQDLNPQRLLAEFAGFAFELGEQVQDAETFLTRKRGDCDDFASLAARLLTERGYRTKLVVVMMPVQTHVVCYVRETGGFLDFNRRALADPVVPSDGTLEDVAAKVARSFRTAWWMAAEVEYQGSQAVFLESAFPLEPGPAEAVPPPTAGQPPGPVSSGATGRDLVVAGPAPAPTGR